MKPNESTETNWMENERVGLLLSTKGAQFRRFARMFGAEMKEFAKIVAEEAVAQVVTEEATKDPTI